MTNQAAQTMPTLPRPYWKAGDVKDDYGNPYNETDLFTDDDMRAMYQQGYAAALSQTAGVVEGKRDREADRLRFPDADFNAWLDAGISDAGHTVYDSISSIEDAWQGWHGHVLSVMLDENPDLDAMLAAAPAASGGECPAGVECARTNPELHRCKREAEAQFPAASVSERARSLMAQAYRDGGFPRAAGILEAGVIDSVDSCALRAIESALARAVPDALRYDYLRLHRHVLLVKGFFGNFCVNKEMADVDAKIDEAIASTATHAASRPADGVRLSLCEQLQQKCSDWGTYWRAPDAHGVILSQDQATELLRDALGVEVEVSDWTPGAWAKLETWLGTYADSIPSESYHELCAIQKLLNPQPLSAGFVVPADPTPKMIESICQAHAGKSLWPTAFGGEARTIRREHAVAGYHAMLASAPTSAQAGDATFRSCTCHTENDKRLCMNKSECVVVTASATPTPDAAARARERRVIEGMPANDREALLYLMQQFDGETWNCERCGHSEDTATMDSADFLRTYLANNPEPLTTPSDAGGDREDEDYHVIMTMGRLLAEIAVILKGTEPAGSAWSYHDLPELVKSSMENAHDIASEMRAWAAVKMRERGSSRRDKMMVEEWSKRLLALPEVTFPVKDFDIPGLSITKEEIRFAIRKVVENRVFIGQDFGDTPPNPGDARLRGDDHG